MEEKLIRLFAFEDIVCKINLKDFFPDIETIKELCDSTPLMRMGTPDDVASLALFLASDSASFITGQCIGVDGGFAV